MSRERPLRWYQQLRWKLPFTYLVLALAPVFLGLMLGFAGDYVSYKRTYTPETFQAITAARAPQAAAILESAPPNAAALSLLLDDVNRDLRLRGREDGRYNLAIYTIPSISSSIEDAAGNVLATAGDRVAEDNALVAEVPLRAAEGRLLGTLVSRVHAPYSWSRHVTFLGLILWGPIRMHLVLVTIFALAFGIVAARSVVARFERISRVAAAWGQGDLSVVIDDHSSDEIGQLAARLNAMAFGLRDVVALRQDLAAFEERNRLARDLHDTVKQQVFALAMQIGAAQVTLDGDRAALSKRLKDAEKLAHSAQQELVAIIRELQPPSRAGKSFAEAIHDYAAEWSRQSGIAADVRIDPELAAKLPPVVENAFVRIAQEALANVLRHSGAKRVAVELSSPAPGEVAFAIADDGAGFDPATTSPGMGLSNMRERAEALPGGRFRIEPAGAHGTRVVAECHVGNLARRS
jgi:signal transduction histidine kinase